MLLLQSSQSVQQTCADGDRLTVLLASDDDDDKQRAELVSAARVLPSATAQWQAHGHWCDRLFVLAIRRRRRSATLTPFTTLS